MGKTWTGFFWVEQQKYCPQCKGHHPWTGKFCAAAEAWKDEGRSEMLQEWAINSAWAQHIRDQVAGKVARRRFDRPMYSVTCPICRRAQQSYDTHGTACSNCERED